MSKVLIIGAGGAGSVATCKCAQAPEVFSAIALASRRKERCDEVASRLDRPIQTAQVDANDTRAVVSLIRDFEPDVVIHLALPYQDLAIMDACCEAGVHYVDTANYESPENPRFEYGPQWAYHERFRERGITALLGCGFDPGVTNAFIAYARKHLFDRIEKVDILDCNAGEHGHPFATNFNTEINIREVTQRGRYWKDGAWQETEPLSVTRTFDFPAGIGTKKLYLIYHEEMESLAKHLPEIREMRFWMTFSDEYLTHLRVLQNVGMTSIEPVLYEGREIVPLKFLSALLPQPSSLGPETRGKTCIGCLVDGTRDGERRAHFVYNVCDHQVCYREVRSQAISYTTGVPAMVGAMMLVTGAWAGPGVFHVEQFDPDPFMEQLNRYGLPWHVTPL